ncbi:MAG: FAD-dependent oxidoreductase [Cocleimonas sp.]
MITTEDTLRKSYEVVIIGSGPAGLATAIELKKLGVNDIIVLERADEAGGNPRHCGHSPFGFREFKRVYFGPAYAKKMVKTAKQLGVKITLNTSVISLGKGGLLTLSTPHGVNQLQAKRVVLSTGIREMPRAPRFVSGQRPAGIMTAGALQSMVYLSGKKPFKKPIIVGSELVSFSAIASCRHAGIKPVAMLEKNQRTTAYRPLGLFPRVLGIKYLLNTQIIDIEGKEQVSGVNVLNQSGEKTHIVCDGVIFTGKFTPEASLLRSANIEIDPNTQGPIIDQFGRCSDPVYFASGNVLRPVETGGWCWNEGVKTAHFVNASLAEKLPSTDTQLTVNNVSNKIKYIVPQRISIEAGKTLTIGMCQFQLRFKTAVKGGGIKLLYNNAEIYDKKLQALPERRVLIAIPEFSRIEFDTNDLVIDYS